MTLSPTAIAATSFKFTNPRRNLPTAMMMAATHVSPNRNLMLNRNSAFCDVGSEGTSLSMRTPRSHAINNGRQVAILVDMKSVHCLHSSWRGQIRKTSKQRRHAALNRKQTPPKTIAMQSKLISLMPNSQDSGLPLWMKTTARAMWPITSRTSSSVGTGRMVLKGCWLTSLIWQEMPVLSPA